MKIAEKKPKKHACFLGFPRRISVRYMKKGKRCDEPAD